METLVPYSLYLSREHAEVMRNKAKTRQASSFLRDAITDALNRTDDYKSGYNKALRDACEVISATKEAKMMLVQNESLDKFLIKQIRDLEE